MQTKFKSLELFYFDACPSWKEAQKILGEALKDLDISDDVELVIVETHKDAVTHQFPGSPTIKING